MEVSPAIRQWLLDDADPTIQYRALRELFGNPSDDPEVMAARAKIGQSGWAARILADQHEEGFWESFRGDGGELYLPKYIATNWRLLVLSDLGVTREDPRIERAAKLIFEHWSGPEGVFGEPGSELCITGNAVRMLTRFGFVEDSRVQQSIRWLVESQKADGGWHCFPSETGTLDCWEALAAFASLPPGKRTPEIERSIERGAEFYLERGLLRESDGTTYPPWSRMHYPIHYYYDVLVGLDTLTRLGYGSDSRLRPGIDLLKHKRNSDGKWILESLHPDLEPNDPYHPTTPVYPFALEHVGIPSRWITLTALLVLQRIEDATPTRGASSGDRDASRVIP